MPKFHEHFDNQLRPAVGLGVLDLNKPLFDALFPIRRHKCVTLALGLLV
jgi:hypothetical protein